MRNEMRDFQDILTDLDDGEVHRRLTEKLRDVVNGARDANLAATLTLKLTVTPDGRQFVVNSKITTSIPTPKTSFTVFFADDQGELRKEDPKQQQLRHVPKTPTELRTVQPKGE